MRRRLDHVDSTGKRRHHAKHEEKLAERRGGLDLVHVGSLRRVQVVSGVAAQGGKSCTSSTYPHALNVIVLGDLREEGEQ